FISVPFIVSCTLIKLKLEGQPRAQLDLAAWRGGFGDSAELGRIHEAVRGAQVRMVECVEEFPAELKSGVLGNGEITRQREIERLQPRPINRIASHIAKRKGRRSGEGGP